MIKRNSLIFFSLQNASVAFFGERNGHVKWIRRRTVNWERVDFMYSRRAKMRRLNFVPLRMEKHELKEKKKSNSISFCHGQQSTDRKKRYWKCSNNLPDPNFDAATQEVRIFLPHASSSSFLLFLYAPDSLCSDALLFLIWFRFWYALLCFCDAYVCIFFMNEDETKREWESESDCENVNL